MDAQPGAVGAGQLDLDRTRGLRPRGGAGHFDEAQGGGRVRHRWRSRRLPGGDLLFEVRQAQPQLFGHARRRHHRSQRHRMGPELWGNLTVWVRPRLAPVGNLAG